MKQYTGFYLIFDSYEHFSKVKNNNGVSKKINSQICAFHNADLCVDIACIGWSLFGNNYVELNPVLRGINRIPFISPKPSFNFNKDINKIDFFYMRRPPYISCNFVQMLKRIKTKNPSVKIIMELPTYPYDKEISNFIHYPLLLKDRLARRHLHKYVDRIATLTDDKEIFGIPTIKIKNGYDFASFPARTPTPPQEPSINLCCVAMFSFWHGYERLIQGLYNHLQLSGNKRIIKIHFAGEGAELEKYKKLVTSLGLKKYVRFYGRLDSKALQELYNSVDIGMNSLGIYKTGGTVGMQLKTREYLAVGLPIVTGVHLDLHDYEEIAPYILEFPNDSSPIDMQKIINFYDRLKLSSVDEATRIANYLHDTGEKYLGMDAAMRNVIDYVVGRQT